MAVNVATGSDNSTVFNVTDGTSPVKAVTINGNDIYLLDRIANTSTARSEIESYLLENGSKTQSELEAGVQLILEKAKAREITDAETIVNSGTGSGEIVKQQYTALDQLDTGGPAPVPVSESANIVLNSQKADARTMDELLGKTNYIDKAYSPESQMTNSVRFSDHLPRLNSTIGGADLSVFYLAEVPAMEDVMDTSLTPDMWRKEIITFEMDNVLSISYSTIRSKFPVRTLGRSNPKAYTYGPRTIAGHMTFAVMAEDILARLRARIYNSFQRNSSLIQQTISNNSLMRKDPNQAYTNEKIQAYWDMAIKLSGVELLDSLPEFDILVMGMNEYGVFSRFVIRQVSIIDENQYMGTTQPNIMNKVTFTALDLVPMASFQYNSGSVVGSLGTRMENIRDQRGGISLRGLSASDILDDLEDKNGINQLDSKSIARLEG